MNSTSLLLIVLPTLQPRRQMVDFHGELVLLLHWSLVNYAAVAKILKKHDKLTGSRLRAPVLASVLHQVWRGSCWALWGLLSSPGGLCASGGPASARARQARKGGMHAARGRPLAAVPPCGWVGAAACTHRPSA